jgi:hypothetical protein
MNLFRLKKEAIPFVKEKYANNVMSDERWEALGISTDALDRIKPPFIKEGIATSKHSGSISGWGSEDESRFHFTVIFPDCTCREYEAIKNELNTAELIEGLEYAAKRFYSDFEDVMKKTEKP